MKGKLFTFEGIEGSGKGTQISLLKDRLNNEGYKVSSLKFYEPGGTDFADTMRSILKQNVDTEFALMHLTDLVYRFQEFNLNPMTQSLLFFAARSDQLEKKVKSELEKGYNIFLDRSCDSTTAYQGYGQDKSLVDWIRETNSLLFKSADVKISKTFYLDVDVKEGLKRAKERDEGKKDYFDKKGEEFFTKVRDGYINEISVHKKLLDENPEKNRLVFVPQDGIEETHNVIYGMIKKYL